MTDTVKDSKAETINSRRSIQVTVLGAGSWGTALAMLLAENGHDVTLWDRNEEIMLGIRRNHINPRYLQGLVLPETIAPERDMADAVRPQTEWVLIAVSSDGVREVVNELGPHLPESTAIISAAKGLDWQTGETMSQVIEKTLDGRKHRGYVAISGPNLAQEVVKRMPTAAVAASPDAPLARSAQEVMNCRERFRIYSSTDVLGVELAGALKNVFAIGAGISDGLGFGDNTKAAFMTRGLAEMTLLGVAAGASPQTFQGLAGVGDLMATATSKLSRNYRVGLGFAEGKPLAKILADLGQVAEGVTTAKAAQILSAKHKTQTPLLSGIHDVIHNGKPAMDAVAELMSRPAKDEF